MCLATRYPVMALRPLVAARPRHIPVTRVQLEREFGGMCLGYPLFAQTVSADWVVSMGLR